MIGIGKEFLEKIAITQEITLKPGKEDYMKLKREMKKILHNEENCKMRQPSKWGESLY